MKTTTTVITFFLVMFLVSCSSDDSTNENPTTTPTPTPITISATGINETLDENSVALNDILGMISTTTNSTEAISFSITSQSPSGALSINATTGELFVADPDAFDFEANPTISATITASNSEATTTTSATIALNDISDVIFTHTATAANSAFNYTYLDHPDLNNNPDAIIVENHNWTPNEVYNDNVTGVWYDAAEGRWAIYNEDYNMNMVPDSSYNVFISKDGDAMTFSTSDATWIHTLDHPDLNNNPDAAILLSNYFNPNEVYNTTNASIIYDASIQKWRLYNESGTGIPVNSSFFIIVGSDNATVVSHETSATNIASDGVPQSSSIDHPILNNDTDAKFVFTRVKLGATFLNKTLGLYYDYATDNKWNIYTEDVSDLPLGINFNIYIVE